MLSKPQRLPKTMFREIFRNGRRISTPSFQIITVPSSESQSKFAVVIGKKVNKFAVKRNLIKRRVHEAIRIWSKKLPRQVNAIILPKAVSIQKNVTDFIHEMEQGVRL